jgi:hypothetical protein
MRRLCAMLLVALAWLAVPAKPVSAAPVTDPAAYKPTDSEALAHFNEGTRYVETSQRRRVRADRDRDLERAITEYTAGQAKDDAPAFDLNLGLVLKVLGRDEDALDHLQRFLERANPDGSLRRSVESKIAALDPTGRLRAERERKRAPRRAPDRPPAIVATSTPVVDAARAPSAAAATPIATPPRVAPPGLAATAVDSPPGHVRWARVGGWGLTAAGVVGGGVTTWLVVDAQRLDRQATDAQANHMVSVRAELADQASARRRSAVMVGIGSGALVVSGVVLLLLSSGGDSPPTRVGWNLGITSHGAAVWGRF